MQHALAGDHPFALVGVGRRAGMAGQHRRLCLLDLQQQGRPIGGDEQADGAERADAADADHLEGRVREAVARQQHAAVFLQCAGIRGESRADLPIIGCVMLDQRRLVLDPRVPGCASAGWCVDQVEMRAAAGQRGGKMFLQLRAQLFGFDVADRRGEVDAAAPGIERWQGGQAGDLLAVAGSGAAGQLATRFVGQRGDAAGHRQAGGEALDVPFERRRQGFVEIIEVEDRSAFLRGRGPEVGEMGVAAGLQAEPGCRQAGEIVGHDGGRAAIEGERIGGHPGVAHRQQTLNALGALVDQDLDGVRPAGLGCHVPMRAARWIAPRRPVGGERDVRFNIACWHELCDASA